MMGNVFISRDDPPAPFNVSTFPRDYSFVYDQATSFPYSTRSSNRTSRVIVLPETIRSALFPYETTERYHSTLRRSTTVPPDFDGMQDKVRVPQTL